jgi:hypothetical protein
MDPLRDGCAGNEIRDHTRDLDGKNKKTAMALQDSASRN